MKTRIILIALFVVANSSSATIEQRTFSGFQSEKITEQTTSVNLNRIGNSTTIISDPIEPTKKTDKSKDDSKKPKRHIFLKVVAGVVGTFVMVISILFGLSDF